MDLKEAQRLAKDLMFAHIVDYGWTFGWDNAVQRMGATHYSTRQITLSRRITAAATEAQVRDTILHEIAHANVGGKEGHGRVWKREAIRLGAQPHAGTADAPNIRQDAAPWVGTCPAGHVSKYRFWRKPKVTRSCSVCLPGKFSMDHVITYTREGGN